MIRLFPQRTEGDCSIACLATFLGRPYATILKVASQITKKPDQNGMYMSQIREVADWLGYDLTKSRKINFDTDEGIIAVDNYSSGWRRRKNGQAEGHVVVLWHGLIYDPTTGGSLWTPKQYRRCNKSKFLSILKK